MKKYVVAGVLVAAIAAYLIFTNSNNSSVVSTGGVSGSTSTNTTSSGSGSAMAGKYKDGTYTGPTNDVIYGQIQVVATISGGKITKVAVPVYPTDGGHTQEVNSMAVPILKQEALAAQSANVNVVSGATQTSQGFEQSLAGALAEAKA